MSRRPGVIAQLVERVVRNDEVRGSTPLDSSLSLQLPPAPEALTSHSMEILIVSPSASVPNGNSNTSEHWASELSALGHTVRIAGEDDQKPADLLIALHAEKSHQALTDFKGRQRSPIVVVLTGTDLYPSLSSISLMSLETADRIVVYQAKAITRLPPGLRGRTRVIHLSHPDHPAPPQSGDDRTDHFTVCVVGHLRTVKDPMRTARAARLLPATSRLRVLHAGAILEDQFTPEVEREQKENPRYRWLGKLTGEEAFQLIASSDLLSLTSSHEGGGRVLNEAAAARTPIVATRNDATTSLLGDDYPGLFSFGNTGELSILLQRCESDPSFQDLLLESARHHLEAYRTTRENENWSSLLAELFPSTMPGS